MTAAASPEPPGPLLGRGRSADVHEVDPEWVLRRYRDGLDASGEALVMAHLHAHGYPVPEVRPPAVSPTRDLVMRRLTGPTLLESLLRGEAAPERAGAVLADLLRRLHALPARVGARSHDRVLHLDLHPDNVVLTADGPVVIDWSNTAEGEPARDWAVSALILAQVAVGGTVVPEAPEAARSVACGTLASLLAGAVVDVPAGLAAARAQRQANPTMSGPELACLDEAVALVADVCAGGRREGGPPRL